MQKFYETIESIFISFIIVTLLILFVFRAIAVDGSSMVPTLHDKERIIVANIMYTPKKGDVVVVDKNSTLNKPIVKRVIATGGDTVKIDYKTGDVYVNGKLLTETYINEKIAPIPNSAFEMTIAQGYVFLMGDNRNHSTDSRATELGQVNIKNILGKAIFKIFPFSSMGIIK